MYCYLALLQLFDRVDGGFEDLRGVDGVARYLMDGPEDGTGAQTRLTTIAEVRMDALLK